MLTAIRKTFTTAGNTQILCGNIIPQRSKQELFVALAVLDYINKKHNKYATREDALETFFLQDCMPWGVLFPCCCTDQLGNLIVRGSEYCST